MSSPDVDFLLYLDEILFNYLISSSFSIFYVPFCGDSVLTIKLDLISCSFI